MRTEAAARRTHQGTEATHQAAQGDGHPPSGRRMKASRPAEGSPAELALAMTDALEHILAYEQRTA